MGHEFVHLHVHSDYSILDGACAVSWGKLKNHDPDVDGKFDLVELVRRQGMKACAITDHGVMGGCLEFHNAMKAAGFKPIIGCETYMAPHSRLEKDINIPNVRGFHLILLAENQKGYHNLCKLISEAHTSGYYYKPRIDKELLAKYHEGIIGSSACLQGEIDYAARRSGYDEAKKVLTEYLDIFGKENFYLELMYHKSKPEDEALIDPDIKPEYLEMVDSQRRVNEILIKLSKDMGVPLIATNDVHYLWKKDAKAHEVLLCIQTRSTMEETHRMRMSSGEFYFKSGDEMYEIFGNEVPEALTNTVAVAERCNVTIGYENHYPEFHPPEKFIATLDLDKLKAESSAEIEQEIEKNAEMAKANGKEPEEIAPEARDNMVAHRITLKEAGAYLRSICLYGTGEGTVCGYKVKYGYDPFNPPEDKKEEAKTNLERMNYELSVIMKTKYPSYFLCVWDFINWAKEHGIPVGPGRGSGAGSIVAYLSGITNIDPMKYDLLFERFLNPDRVSPPDFDTDFCERRRQDVIDYVTKKYGSDCVSQIGTYGTLKTKVALKDIARALGRLPADGNLVTKTIPDDPKMTLKKAMEQSPDLRELVEKESWVKEAFGYASSLEMLNRQMGIHACGVIICNEPLASIVPLGRGAHEEVITEYVAPLCENVGLLKMDFLGLRTLTVIQDACDNVFKSRGIRLNMDKIPLDDKKTYDLLNNGDTVAVFQLESGGMQDLCRKFGVENIKHIIALVAIYRPGPMQFIDLFVGRKKGTIPVEYDHPKMESLLKETYGIMLYQEQIMQVVQVLAGFSLGQADILRRAIGKKKINDMEKQHNKFIAGCAATNNIPTERAEIIWENIKKFADYGFNKSHSAAYAIMSYRTAYLKANYRPEFMAAVMTSELSNSSKIAFLIGECRESGIKILPPDVNSSDKNFSVDKGAIRFGLGAIKGFGTGASDSIIEAREKDGPFTSMSDLLERTEGINSKALESLIRAGAMDSFGLKRSQLLAIMDISISAANKAKEDKENGQGSLFDVFGGEEQSDINAISVPDIPELSDDERLSYEKQLLGFYVSGHPLQKFNRIAKTFSTAKMVEVLQMPNDVGVKLGAFITSVSRKLTKQDQKPFAVFQLEDMTGSVECVCYPRTYEKCKEYLVENTSVFVRAMTKRSDEENATLSLTVEDVIPIQQVYHTDSEALHIHFHEERHTVDDLERVNSLLLAAVKQNAVSAVVPQSPPSDRGEFYRRDSHRQPTAVPVVLCVHTKENNVGFVDLPHRYDVMVTESLLKGLEGILGDHCYRVKADKDVPKARPRYENKRAEA